MKENSMKNKEKIWQAAVVEVMRYDAHKHELGEPSDELSKMVAGNPWLPRHVGSLINANGRHDQKTGSLLMLAAWKDAVADVELLAPLSNTSLVDSLGDSAMIYALLCSDNYKRMRMIKALLPCSDLGLQSAYRDKRTPAMFAIYRGWGYEDSATMLLEAMTLGDARVKCSDGDNVLHKIVQCESVALLNVILGKEGASELLEMKNNRGISPKALIQKMRECGSEHQSEFLANFEQWELGGLLVSGEEISKKQPRRQSL